MKFYIFSFWEKENKRIMCFFVSLLTIALVIAFCVINRGEAIYEQFVFIAPIVYSLLLFFVGIILDKSKNKVDEKLYEREKYFLTLVELRSLTNSTINKLTKDDISDIKSKIILFQIMTGRDEETIRNIAKGNKSPHFYVQENGFVYTTKMLTLESAALSYIDGNDNSKVQISGKPIQKLFRYYKKQCNKLEKNYLELKSVYGGAMQHLVEYDNFVLSLDSVVNDITTKISKLLNEFDESGTKIEMIESKVDLIKEDITELNQQVNDCFDYLTDIVENFHKG